VDFPELPKDQVMELEVAVEAPLILVAQAVQVLPVSLL
jgi:hypothetical protein